jgi:hypothetical protein
MKGVLGYSKKIREIDFSIFAHQYVPFLPTKFNGNVVFELPLVSSLKKTLTCTSFLHCCHKAMKKPFIL